MPEGHTIHRLAQDLTRDFAGCPVQLTSPQGRFPEAQRLSGQIMRPAQAIGKHLFLMFEGKIRRNLQRIHIHLGLFGKFQRRPLEHPVRATVRLHMVHGSTRWDLIGPTACHLLSPTDFKSLCQRLGADPLAQASCPLTTWQRLHKSKRPIGALLLDQALISGIGNVYRAEILFILGIHPSTPGCAIPEAAWIELWQLSRRLMQLGVKTNRIITVNPAERRGLPRTSRYTRYVYKQRACRRCKGPIEQMLLANRTAYFCPTCQPVQVSSVLAPT